MYPITICAVGLSQMRNSQMRNLQGKSTAPNDEWGKYNSNLLVNTIQKLYLIIYSFLPMVLSPQNLSQRQPSVKLNLIKKMKFSELTNSTYPDLSYIHSLISVMSHRKY